MPFDRNRVINKMVDWIDTNLTPPDQAMVVSFAAQSMKIIQPFTSDPDEIASALRSLKKLVGGRSDAINSRQRVEDDINENSSQTSPGAAASSAGYAQVLDEAKSFSREARNNLQFAVRALQDLVGMMGGLPGKKVVIYLSDGLPMTPAAKLYYEIEEQFQATAALTESREFDSTDLYSSLVRTAISAGVTLYSIDARGLQDEGRHRGREPAVPLAARRLHRHQQLPGLVGVHGRTYRGYRDPQRQRSDAGPRQDRRRLRDLLLDRLSPHPDRRGPHASRRGQG